MKDYGVYNSDLDTLTIETAMKIVMQCENESIDTAKKVGMMWKPTRQIAWEAMRTACDETYSANRKLERAIWISGISSAISVASVILLLLLR